MANKTRAEMITLSLKRLGVLGSGQSASAADSDIAGDVLDSVHDQLMARGLVNFATSAFPSWSHGPFAKIMEEELGPYFGKYRPGLRDAGERELAEQMQVPTASAPTEVKMY